MQGGKAMANDIAQMRAPLFNGWRIAGWSIPVILLILPAVAMRYTSEVDWNAPDFIIMGAVFGTIGLGIEFLIRQSRSIAYRVGAVVALVTTFLTIWVNIAVGMVGDNNPYNLLFGGVLMIAFSGAILSKFRPAGMATSMFVAAAAQAAVAAGGFATDPRGAIFSLMFALPWILSGALFRRASTES
jgi:hypothetical protein